MLCSVLNVRAHTHIDTRSTYMSTFFYVYIVTCGFEDTPLKINPKSLKKGVVIYVINTEHSNSIKIV